MELLKKDAEQLTTHHFMATVSIKDWPLDQRPREKLIKHGAKLLSDAELLAVFLRTGIAGKSALALAQDLLTKYGSLGAIVSANAADFCKTKGLGLAKWSNLAASSEITRRALQQNLQQGDLLTSPDAVKAFLQLWFVAKPYEAFVVLFLNAQHRLIESRELFRGTVNQTAVYPREIIRQALEVNACSLIVSHNHPSGATEPSHADKMLTNAIKAAAVVVDIKLIDHIIVAGSQSLSFAEQGLL